MPVSAAVYANYCRELTRLSVWYARKRIVDGSSDFEDAFNKRVNIFRNTSYYTGDGHPANGDVFPQWRVLLDTVRPVFEAHIAAADTEVLEAKCLELFWPSIVERVENVGNPLPDMAERPYKSWSFDYRHEALNIHIDNTYRPASPLVETTTGTSAVANAAGGVTHVTRSWLTNVAATGGRRCGHAPRRGPRRPRLPRRLPSPRRAAAAPPARSASRRSAVSPAGLAGGRASRGGAAVKGSAAPRRRTHGRLRV